MANIIMGRHKMYMEIVLLCNVFVLFKKSLCDIDFCVTQITKASFSLLHTVVIVKSHTFCGKNWIWNDK